MICYKMLLFLQTRVGYTTRLPVTHGYVSRLRARFPVTHGYVSRLRSPVPGYVWLRYSVTQPGSRLRRVT